MMTRAEIRDIAHASYMDWKDGMIGKVYTEGKLYQDAFIQGMKYVLGRMEKKTPVGAVLLFDQLSRALRT